APDCPVPCLVTPNPYAIYAHVAQMLYPEPPLQSGVHPSAVVDDDCQLGAGVEVCAGVVIGAGTVIGDRAYIGPNTVIGNNVTLGADTRLFAQVTLYDGVTLGERCRIHAGTVVGSDGFGIAPSDTGWVKVPQIGSVVIGNDVEVGANCCIDRGAIDDTRLGDDVKLDNQVQIAHNVVIGAHTAIAGQSGVAGSTTIGERCLIGGSVAVSGHLTVADNVSVMGRGSVSRSIDQPGVYSAVFSVEEAGKWRKIAARVKRLDAMAGKLRELESAVKKLAAGK
ncbi:MAG: UDP-3-O-(3-hydroxymyristoyl)glucosamine N-acyltransferase, partial [Gammaproteobacteria bacterium]|nr:UDP-3-O-(3-hydroxymyristoyl)glucosamine N-acyltransferase [Gammaproteobacteria bacterium]